MEGGRKQRAEAAAKSGEVESGGVAMKQQQWQGRVRKRVPESFFQRGFFQDEVKRKLSLESICVSSFPQIEKV